MSWYDFIFGQKALSDIAKQGDSKPATPAPDAGINISKMAEEAAARAAAGKKAVPKTDTDSRPHAYDWKRGNLNQ